MTGRQNVGSGTVARRAVWELLGYALTNAWNGTIVFDDGSGRYAVELVAGVPVKAKLAVPGTRVGELCVARGLVDEEELVSLLGEEFSDLLGARLLRLGLADSTQLDAVLDEQLSVQMEWLAKLPPHAQYALYADRPLLKNWGGPPREIDPLAAIWRVAKATDTSERFLAFVERLGTVELRIHPSARLDRFGFSAELKPILDVLRVKPLTYEALIGTGLASVAVIQRVVSCLALCRHVAVREGTMPAGVDPTEAGASNEARPRQRSFGRPASAPRHRDASKPPPAVISDDETGEMRAELLALSQRCSELSYYELLDVTADSDSTSVQAAFFHVAKRWHPDRLPAGLKDMKDSATRVFARMTEAHQVLSNPSQRAEYDRLIAQGEDMEQEQQQVEQVLRAATAFQKAEILLRRDDVKGALEHARSAHSGDPAQTEYAALYGWVLCRACKLNGETDFGKALSLVKKASRSSPNNVKIRLYNARVLKQAGKLEEAFREFKHVAQEQPGNVEAVREVRLYRMRKGDEEPQKNGLLDRLFKR